MPWPSIQTASCPSLSWLLLSIFALKWENIKDALHKGGFRENFVWWQFSDQTFALSICTWFLKNQVQQTGFLNYKNQFEQNFIHIFADLSLFWRLEYRQGVSRQKFVFETPGITCMLNSSSINGRLASHKGRVTGCRAVPCLCQPLLSSQHTLSLRDASLSLRFAHFKIYDSQEAKYKKFNNFVAIWDLI